MECDGWSSCILCHLYYTLFPNALPFPAHSTLTQKKRKERKNLKPLFPLKQTPPQECNVSMHFLELTLLLRGKERGKPSLGIRPPCRENMQRKEWAEAHTNPPERGARGGGAGAGTVLSELPRPGRREVQLPGDRVGPGQAEATCDIGGGRT